MKVQKTPAKLQKTPAKLLKLVEDNAQNKSKSRKSNYIADKCALLGGKSVVENQVIPAHRSRPNLPSKPPDKPFEIMAGKPDQPISFLSQEITRPSTAD